MANEMERVEKFEKTVSKEEGFIQAATSYLYDHIEDPSTQEIIECTRAIVCSNQEYLDKRETSIDSRSSVIGCIAEDQVIGKIFCKLWPLADFEFIG